MKLRLAIVVLQMIMLGAVLYSSWRQYEISQLQTRLRKELKAVAPMVTPSSSAGSAGALVTAYNSGYVVTGLNGQVMLNSNYDPDYRMAVEGLVPYEAMATPEGVAAFRKWASELDDQKLAVTLKMVVDEIEASRRSEKQAFERREQYAKTLPRAKCERGFKDGSITVTCRTAEMK